MFWHIHLCNCHISITSKCSQSPLSPKPGNWFSNHCRLFIFPGVSHQRSPMEEIILHSAFFIHPVFEIYSCTLFPFNCWVISLCMFCFVLFTHPSTMGIQVVSIWRLLLTKLLWTTEYKSLDICHLLLRKYLSRIEGSYDNYMFNFYI